MIFDSHKHYRQLIVAGSTPDQADVLATVLSEFRAQFVEYITMRPQIFDSHQFYKRLIAAGGSPALAEAHLDIMRDLIAPAR